MVGLVLALAMLQQVNAAASSAPVQAGDALCARIETLVSTPEVARAHWGVSVTAADGTPLCSLDALKLFRPASTNKIFTSAAALALLGADKTFATTVTADGRLRNGTLTGNLRLVGGGDANFGTTDVPYVEPVQRPYLEPSDVLGRPKQSAPQPSTIADVEALADQILARGVRRVTGDVVGDDTYFAWEPYPPEWTAGDLMYGYGAPVSALSVHDNEVGIRVTADVVATPAVAVNFTPAVPWFSVENTATVSAARQGCGRTLVIERELGSRLVKVQGAVPPAEEGCGESLAINQPAEYAASALKLALEQRGVKIDGKARAQHRDADQPGGVFTGQNDADDFLRARMDAATPQPLACAAPDALSLSQASRVVLANHISSTLLADEVFTLKTSQNLHAELLLRNLGAAYSCDRTERGSLHVLREFLLHAGVDGDDFVLYDGSGLSGHDLVAPRAFTTFLTFATHQPWFVAWRATLPVGGVDGTLHGRFKGPLKARVFAKTGTLGESSALAGFVVTNTGATRAFSIMVDNHTPMNPAHRAAIDAIVAAIAGQTMAFR
jgi:D-alanyl-D-alanine carboxypeptidase/D-alanyl-D-alanine-endopeptidase (penicillin-binding protein 4)